MKDIKELGKMDIDYFIELRKRCFDLLETIAATQMKIADNIQTSNHVKEWDVYLKKQTTRLQAYRDAKSTIESIIKNIDSHSNIEASLKKIEDALQLEVDNDG